MSQERGETDLKVEKIVSLERLEVGTDDTDKSE
jgi:hypothetical protein